jgi:hypothetical protein
MPPLKLKLLFELTHLLSEALVPPLDVLDRVQVVCRDFLGERLPPPIIRDFLGESIALLGESIALGLYPINVDVQRTSLFHRGGKVLLRRFARLLSGDTTLLRSRSGVHCDIARLLRGGTALLRGGLALLRDVAFQSCGLQVRTHLLEAQLDVLRAEPLVLRHVDGCSCRVCGKGREGGSRRCERRKTKTKHGASNAFSSVPTAALLL